MTTRLGFACHWWTHDPAATWSGTPWALRAALRHRADIADVGFTLPGWQVAALKAMGARRAEGRWVTTWRYGPGAHLLGERALAAGVRRTGVTQVLQMQDLAVLSVPYLVLQDLSYDMLLERFGPDGALHFPGLGADRLRRLRDRQRGIYAEAAGLLPMSQWMARSLQAAGIPADKIRVVPPGASALPPPGTALPDRAEGARRRLLFVGRDVRTKAGDQVVAALALLRRDVDPEITLTMVGPTSWPWPGEVPPGITFLGAQPREVVARLYDEHDLFVLPSRFEGFGIAFVEALARGLPCIGRDDCAMPEIIDAGITGALVTGDDPGELAATIAAVLADDGIYATCRDRAAATASYYSWDRAAADVLSAAAAAALR